MGLVFVAVQVDTLEVIATHLIVPHWVIAMVMVVAVDPTHAHVMWPAGVDKIATLHPVQTETIAILHMEVEVAPLLMFAVAMVDSHSLIVMPPLPVVLSVLQMLTVLGPLLPVVYAMHLIKANTAIQHLLVRPTATREDLV